MLQARLNQDDHANPSLQVRPDGRLVVYYSAHVGPAMSYRVSTQPEDVTAWGPPQTIPTNTPGLRGYTYPNPSAWRVRTAPICSGAAGTTTRPSRLQDDGETTGLPPGR